MVYSSKFKCIEPNFIRSVVSASGQHFEWWIEKTSKNSVILLKLDTFTSNTLCIQIKSKLSLANHRKYMKTDTQNLVKTISFKWWIKYHFRFLFSISDEPTINQTNCNVVEGIDLDEIKEFAKEFKTRRQSLGLTQTQVGQALSVTEGPAYSQSAICRLDNLSFIIRECTKHNFILLQEFSKNVDHFKIRRKNQREA